MATKHLETRYKLLQGSASVDLIFWERLAFGCMQQEIHWGGISQGFLLYPAQLQLLVIWVGEAVRGITQSWNADFPLEQHS